MRIWIWGGTSGLGLELARLLQARGHEILVLGRRAVEGFRCERFDLRWNGGAIALQLRRLLLAEGMQLGGDDRRSVLEHLEFGPKGFPPEFGWRKFWFLSQRGAPDLAIVSSGVAAYVRQDQWRDHDWIDCGGREHMAIGSQLHVNAEAPAWISNELIRAMRRRRSGRIILVGSRVAGNGAHALEIYGMAKAALRGYVLSACRHPAKRGVTLSLYEPGWFRSPMSAGLSSHIQESATAKWGEFKTSVEVAEEMLAAIDKLKPGEIAGDDRYPLIQW
jgi:NAD(P)-dependent dehydrogenase (short-subunit alcohol dehydrogenase family)